MRRRLITAPRQRQHEIESAQTVKSVRQKSSGSPSPIDHVHEEMARRKPALLPGPRYSAAPPRSRNKRRSFATLALCGLCIWLLSWLRTPSLRGSVLESDLPVVTLASSAARLNSSELAITLRSLLRQTVKPAQIRLYLTEDDREVFEWHKTHVKSRLSRYLNDEKINLYYVKDVGPSTKLVYAIRELLEKGQENQSVIVLDDDHSYSPDLVSTLVSYSKLETYAKTAVGLRGWRVRSDLHWGVSPEEIRDHVADGWKLAEPFRVGVLTANEGYLIKPSFFLNVSNLDNHTLNWSSRAPLLDLHQLNASAAYLVDDIWLNGHLSAQGIPRFVVPLTLSKSRLSPSTLILANDAVPSIDVTKAHTLEGRIQREGYTRETANWVALQIFKDAWRKEGLFYVSARSRLRMSSSEAAIFVPSYLKGVRLMRREVLKLYHHIHVKLVFGQ